MTIDRGRKAGSERQDALLLVLKVGEGAKNRGILGAPLWLLEKARQPCSLEEALSCPHLDFGS